MKEDGAPEPLEMREPVYDEVEGPPIAGILMFVAILFAIFVIAVVLTW